MREQAGENKSKSLKTNSILTPWMVTHQLQPGPVPSPTFGMAFATAYLSACYDTDPGAGKQTEQLF